MKPCLYGETVIVAALLVMLPMVAVMVTVPPPLPVVRPVAIVTVPADTVARLVLLEVQLATEVTSGDPLQVVAVAVSATVVLLLVTVPLVGFTVIEVMQPTVTVTVCVALTAELLFEVAVTVAVPTLADVTRPVREIVAIEPSEGVMDQVTDGLVTGWLSLFVPLACICTVLSVLPVSIVGEGGDTVRD